MGAFCQTYAYFCQRIFLHNRPSLQQRQHIQQFQIAFATAIASFETTPILFQTKITGFQPAIASFQPKTIGYKTEPSEQRQARSPPNTAIPKMVCPISPKPSPTVAKILRVYTPSPSSYCCAEASYIPHPSSLIPHPSSLIPHPSSLIPHPSPFIPSPYVRSRSHRT